VYYNHNRYCSKFGQAEWQRSPLHIFQTIENQQKHNEGWNVLLQVVQYLRWMLSTKKKEGQKAGEKNDEGHKKNG